MRKLGRVFCPTGEWTHASTPTACQIDGDLWRVYFASRDPKNRSHIFSLDLDMRKPTDPFNIQGPLMSPGPRGTFDDSGLSPACVHEDRLYYLGWNLGVGVPFRNAIGALFRDKDRLVRYIDGPLLDRSFADPISLAYPYVFEEMMYYSSNLEWGETDQDMKYPLKVAWRKAYNKWEVSTIPLLYLRPGETALVRPSVLKDDRYRMWFAVKTKNYRIGYAESGDGHYWERKPFDFDVTPGGFDSESVTYPNVFDHKGRYMLYNGDGYGKTGFGIAVFDD